MIRLPAYVTALLVAAAFLATGTRARVQKSDSLHRPLDEVLDVYVRDGLVYYRALRSERRKLDSYLSALERVEPSTLSSWAKAEQQAFWLNAYNAHVLRTVIDHYPINGRSPDYPRNSIRQIAGAFEKRPYRVAGRTVTLDQIELDVLAGFGDPRVCLALGRGSVGGGRLRSEAFSGDRLEAQLRDVVAEFTTRRELLRIDQAGGTISTTPILSWREALFVRAYAEVADARYVSRSPIERALLALITPHLLPSEREFVQRNDFEVTFHAYDWRLNDLTGGGPR
jgi:hypothetical protein